MSSSDPQPKAGPGGPWPPAEADGFDPADAWGWDPPRERQVRPADLLAGVLTALAVAVLGVPVGALWVAFAPRFIGVVQGNFVYPVDPESAAPIARDGVFALLGVAAGLLCGLLAYLLARRHGAATACGLVLGGLLASVIAWQLGRHVFGPADLAHLRPRPAEGTRFRLPLTLGAKGMLLAWPIGAAFLFFLLSTIANVSARARTRIEAEAGLAAAGPGGARRHLGSAD